MRLGLLPSAGTASRMNGIPKFLLPVSDELQCLLDYHVRLMQASVDRIIIPTRTEWVRLLESFDFGDSVSIVELNTSTMAETLRRALDGLSYDTCVLGMPDTYFMHENPYAELQRHQGYDLTLRLYPTRPEQVGKVGSVRIDSSHDVTAHADKDPEADFGWHWGVMEFARHTEEFLNPQAATGGYLIDECLSRGLKVKGFPAENPYFDCGTFPEYLQCLTHLQVSERDAL